jgi:hypothetical protein
MKLRDFLLLTDIASVVDSTVTASAKKRKVSTVSEADTSGGISMDSTRRVTRSMSRTSSLYIPATQQQQRHSQLAVPSTPQLHPLLPETPAALRKAIKLAKATTDDATERLEEFKKPVRVARSTIRLAPSEDAHFKPPNPIVPPSTKKPAHSKSPPPLDSTVVSLEMSDGKLLDVDLSQSPKTMFKGMGKEAVKEVKSKMQTYAQQLRAFFKKLNF